MRESAKAADGKADFNHIYDRPDPRAYFRTLRELDYEIPQQAEPVFRALLTALGSRPQVAEAGPVRVLDLCCSYGINAALLRCDVRLDELFDRYSSPSLDELSPAELARADEEYYAERRRPNAVSVSGLDLAANAVDYGCRVGLLDGGWAEDLEHGDPSDQLTDRLDEVDLVTTTGGVGYITDRTFDRVLGARRGGSMPWVAAFALRIYSYDRIAETLARHGLVTQELTGVTFPQRRFASEAEREDTLRQVSGRGMDPSGREDSGRYHANFYLSRPTADAQQPLTHLLDGAVPQ
ncbi:MAG TPA: hypothetical protein VFD59_05525 [Nocardioidaceae bacterium]|nr:hypothetical protein [Nocardioidaceae bacterium]